MKSTEIALDEIELPEDPLIAARMDDPVMFVFLSGNLRVNLLTMLNQVQEDASFNPGESAEEYFCDDVGKILS